MYVRYHERLTDQTLDVEIPDTRDQAFDAIALLDRLAHEDPAAWKATYRQLTACDWYVLALCLSGAQRLDPFTGRPELDCDFQFNFGREMQFDGDGVLDKSARGHFKSFWRTYVGVTNVVLNDPDITAAIIAHNQKAALKHGMRTKMEWESNPELKLAWEEVFYANPLEESPVWNNEKGWSVKRRITSVLPTLSCWGISSPPVGSRVGLFIPDDVETDVTMANEDMRKQTKEQFQSFLKLAGRAPRIWPNGTHHHSDGLVSDLEASEAFRVRCHAAEDVTLPAPDIAAIFDAAGGYLPTISRLAGEGDAVEPGGRQRLPPGVRNVRLDGAATFLHPLELAHERLKAMATPGGLASYYQQFMGDARAGQDRRFEEEWFPRYRGRPEERARDQNLLLIIDPSKGINDPTVALMVALHADETHSLVGGIRKKIPPSAFGAEMFAFWAKWEQLGHFTHCRVEVYAQAIWDTVLSEYWAARNRYLQVVPVGRNVDAIGRYWNMIEPLARNGRIWLPETPIWAEDEFGIPYDLVEFMLKKEFKNFPTMATDDCLAAWALLGEPAVPKKIPELEYPSDYDTDLRDRGENRLWERQEEGPGGDGDGAWMEAW